MTMNPVRTNEMAVASSGAFAFAAARDGANNDRCRLRPDRDEPGDAYGGGATMAPPEKMAKIERRAEEVQEGTQAALNDVGGLGGRSLTRHSRSSSARSTSSGISFECHSSFILEGLSAMIDEDERERTEESEENGWSAYPQEDLPQQAQPTQQRAARAEVEAAPPKPPVVSFRANANVIGGQGHRGHGVPHRRSSNISAGLSSHSSAYSSNGDCDDLSLGSIAEDSVSACCSQHKRHPNHNHNFDDDDSINSLSSNLSNISLTRRFEARQVRRAISSGNVSMGMFRSHSHAGFAARKQRAGDSFLGRVVRSASGNRVAANARVVAASNANRGKNAIFPGADVDAAGGLPARQRPVTGANTAGIWRQQPSGNGPAACCTSNPFQADMDGAGFVRLLRESGATKN